MHSPEELAGFINEHTEVFFLGSSFAQEKFSYMYNSGWDDCWKFWKEPLKDTRILFCGHHLKENSGGCMYCILYTNMCDPV